MLKNKRILITAGPTWVPIDNVRVISNIATGQTGVFLANELAKKGAWVTLVLGPCVNAKILNRRARLISFKFFDELKKAVEEEIKTKKYDIVIHSAAVSDYTPKMKYGRKIKSGIKNFRLELKPTAKIIDCVKKIQPEVFLVGFKFETGKSEETLFKETRSLIKRSNLDLAVANTVNGGKYKAYILSGQNISGPFLNKIRMVKNLINRIRYLLQETNSG